MAAVKMHHAGYEVEVQHGRAYVRTVYVDHDGREWVRDLWDTNRYVPLDFIAVAYPTYKRMSQDRLGHLKHLFHKFYDEFYDSYDADPDFSWYVGEGDRLLGACDPQLNAFCRYRGDVLTSDRELAAYVKACEYVGWL